MAQSVIGVSLSSTNTLYILLISAILLCVICKHPIGTKLEP